MGKPGKANPENLIPLNTRPIEEQRAICSKAGKASGESKRRAKSLREAAKFIGEGIIKDKDGEDVTRNYVLVMKQYELALRGNKDAVRFIAKLLGEFADTDQANAMVNQTIELHID